MDNQRLEGIRKMLTDSVEQTAPSNHARGWRTDCEYLLSKTDDLSADLAACVPHLRILARLCEACEGFGEILESDDTAEECPYCRPLWQLIERIDPRKPAPVQQIMEMDDDIAF